ncbi:MAG: NAD(P)H-dependent oxidoreductase [Actinobacteria bacterium]|nr:NAD(P)H-dependent oxidoreductase [Actinomycetota bacterium]MBU1945017.1 NAD(P)H-dependent oxidoreductase [Actinomycetota bacterium]MBU2686647.1 NAD(P)H-dependent oxidoreductase [Actinomycetota bacterium]
MKVLAITGNPKKKGSLADLTAEVVRGVEEGGVEVEVVRLADLNLGYCRFCLKCRDATGPQIASCVQEDGLAGLIEKILEADGFILACQTSGGHASVLMKTLIERTCYTLGSPTRRILWVYGCPDCRIRDKQRFAVVVTTAGVVPTWSRAFCNGANREMAQHAEGIFNAKVVGRLYGGNVWKHGVTRRVMRKALKAGHALAASIAHHSLVRE